MVRQKSIGPRDSFGGTYAYDAENRLVAYCPSQTDPAQCSSTWVSRETVYSYDGEGRRVRTKVDEQNVTTYVYDASGQLMAEYGPAAPIGTAALEYLTVDQLGSTRLVTNVSGVPVSRMDYLPFGVQVPSSLGGRSNLSDGGVPTYFSDGAVKQKFTGKERDTETGLDYFGARYMSAAQGRFTSPDAPLIDQSPHDPQSWNLYAYGRNNPLKFTDPTGNSAESAQAENEYACRIGASGCNPDFVAGMYLSPEGRYAMQVAPNGNVKFPRMSSQSDPTGGPVLDAMILGPVLSKALQAALRAASERLGLEVAADVGIAVNKARIGEALADQARVLHGGRHLVEEGLIKGATNAAIASGTRGIVAEILSKPLASFIARIGVAEGEVAVRVFVGKVEGKLVGVALAEQAVGSVAKGGLVTIKIFSH